MRTASSILETKILPSPTPPPSPFTPICAQMTGQIGALPSGDKKLDADVSTFFNALFQGCQQEMEQNHSCTATFDWQKLGPGSDVAAYFADAQKIDSAG